MRHCRHSREGGNDSPHGVCPKALFRHAREGGNPSAFATHACPSTGHAPGQCPRRHAREGGNPWAFATHACPSTGHAPGQCRAVIPAKPVLAQARSGNPCGLDPTRMRWSASPRPFNRQNGDPALRRWRTGARTPGNPACDTRRASPARSTGFPDLTRLQLIWRRNSTNNDEQCCKSGLGILDRSPQARLGFLNARHRDTGIRQNPMRG